MYEIEVVAPWYLGNSSRAYRLLLFIRLFVVVLQGYSLSFDLCINIVVDCPTAMSNAAERAVTLPADVEDISETLR